MTDLFLYFAYGSNMLTRRLTNRVGGVTKVGIGYVPGRTLTFDKKSTDGSGKCHCPPSRDENRVWGILFQVPVNRMGVLDGYEGVGHGYHVEYLTVYRTDGSDTYVADPGAKNPSLQPYHWYKQHVLSGAEEHGLPADYVSRFIRTVQSQPDPDATRRSREEAI